VAGRGPVAVTAEGLSKVFRPPAGLRQLLRGRVFGEPVNALSDVSFTVARGEILCVMGANGAGKSTLVKILGGLLLPTQGRAQVAGLDVKEATPEFRRRVSFVVSDERSWEVRASGRTNLQYFADHHGFPSSVSRPKVSELLERVGLSAAADRIYREYSRGMRQRLAIARGLLGDPQVLLFDEPTLGVDPRGARELRSYLRKEVILGAGRTAVVCSNDPSEVRELADRVLFLEKGHKVTEVRPDQVDQVLGL
jgi:ABC-2 type transport system ATP-binding protein